MNKIKISKILLEYKTKNIKDFQSKYHIIINNDGSIYDCVQKIQYDALISWINTKLKENTTDE